MILTVLLSTVLISAALFLAAIASPVRFGWSLSYRKTDTGNTAYKLWISYIHPLVYRKEYSSENEYARTVILGFERKRDIRSDDDWWGDAGGHDDDAEPINTASKRTGTDSAPADTDYKSEDADVKPVNTGRKPSAPQGGTDNPRTGNCRSSGREESDNRRGGKEDINSAKKRPRGRRHILRPLISVKNSLVSTVKKYADRVRGHSYYKIISDRPLRKKLLRWLRNLINGIFTTVSFDSFRLRARVGGSDPAALGKAYGYFTAAREAIELRNHSVELAMEPVFTEECLDIDMEAAGRTTISVIMWRLLVIAVTFPYLRLRRVTKTENKKEPAGDAPTSSSLSQAD